MSHSVARDTLGSWLAEEASSGRDDVAVLAGHYAIMSAGGAAVDRLADGVPPPAGAAAMVDFTRDTWRIACDVAAANPAHRFRFVVLVDDIQFVRPLLADRAGAERLGAAIAEQYLGGTPELPHYHAAEFASRGIGAGRILRHSAQRSLFSERELRQNVVHRLRRCAVAGGGERARLASSDDGSTLTVSLPDLGTYRLVQSGHSTCAGGYVELVTSLYERGVRKLVALVPARCLGQVALGTRLAFALTNLPGLSVVNVAVGDAGITTDAVVDHHGTD